MLTNKRLYRKVKTILPMHHFPPNVDRIHCAITNYSSKDTKHYLRRYLKSLRAMLLTKWQLKDWREKNDGYYHFKTSRELWPEDILNLIAYINIGNILQESAKYYQKMKRDPSWYANRILFDFNNILPQSVCESPDSMDNVAKLIVMHS